MIEIDRAALMILSGTDSGMRMPLSGRPIMLGRGADNDVVVDEPAVSRRHAMIMETPEGFILRDLRSRNGTYVNRERVGQRDHLLRHVDQIRLADSRVIMVFRQEGATTQEVKVSSGR